MMDVEDRRFVWCLIKLNKNPFQTFPFRMCLRFTADGAEPMPVGQPAGPSVGECGCTQELAEWQLGLVAELADGHPVHGNHSRRPPRSAELENRPARSRQLIRSIPYRRCHSPGRISHCWFRIHNGRSHLRWFRWWSSQWWHPCWYGQPKRRQQQAECLQRGTKYPDRLLARNATDLYWSICKHLPI